MTNVSLLTYFENPKYQENLTISGTISNKNELTSVTSANYEAVCDRFVKSARLKMKCHEYSSSCIYNVEPSISV